MNLKTIFDSMDYMFTCKLDRLLNVNAGNNWTLFLPKLLFITSTGYA